MRNRFNYLVLIIILVASMSDILLLASAAPLTPDQSIINLNVTKGISKTFEIGIRNSNNYTLYDIKTEGEYVTSTPITLQANETKNLSIVASVSTSGVFEKTIKLVGFTRINCSSLAGITKSINITPSGAMPKNLEICKNINIQYTNFYGNSIWLVIQDMAINQAIGVNASHIQNFPTVGTFAYRIEPLIDLGYIAVVDSVQNVYSQNDEGSFLLRLKSSLEATNISFSVNRLVFNVSYDKIETSFLTVKNTGSFIAEKITLIGQDGWLTFDKNNFNLNPNEEVAINFAVSPRIDKSSDTGKTWYKTMTISSENSPQSVINVSIFIPYAEISSGNLSSPEWWKRRKEFCDKYPTAPDCITEPIVVYRNVPEFGCPEILVNMSPIEIKRYIDEVRGLRDDWASLANNLKLDMDTTKNHLGILASQSNSSLFAQLENKAAVIGLRDTTYFFIGMGLLGVFIGIVGYALYKYYKKKKLEGTFI